jgi:type IV pilus assembly protein PilC
MVQSGMTILRALYVLEAQTESKPLRTRRQRSARTSRPASAVRRARAPPKVFSPLFVAMTRAGETGGMLEDSLHRASPTSSRRRTRCAARSSPR